MKYYLLLVLFISVAAAYSVIEGDSKSYPKTTDPHDSRDTFRSRSPLTGSRDPEVTGGNAGPSPPSAHNISSFSSMFNMIRDSMKRMMERTRPSFSNHFPEIFRIKPKTNEDSTPFKGAFPHHVFPGPLGSVFKNSHLAPHLRIPSAHEFPKNYSNHTSQVHDTKDGRLVVNQTVDKKSGDGINNFFVVKSFQLFPKNETKIKKVDQKVSIKHESAKNTPKPDTRLNEIKFDQFPGKGQPQNKERTHHRLRREIRNQFVDSSPNTGNKAIEFPPSHLNRFPQSFLNTKNSEGESISKSYVYKNIGGKTTMYIVDHKPKNKSKYVEAVDSGAGEIPPPDLSRDTKVNPSGNDDHQQSLVLVHPDAEVFDLSLVAKEIESRPKDK